MPETRVQDYKNAKREKKKVIIFNTKGHLINGKNS